jgi:hypothetical protein
MKRWQPGDHVVLRELWRGRVWAAYPAVVVEDEEPQQLFFIPAGTEAKYAVDEHGRELRLYEPNWDLADRLTVRSFLSFSWPERSHSVIALWDPHWRFEGWYVNIETPVGRSPISYDYIDHCLDVLIPPDRSGYAWKDEEELEEAVRRGIFSARQAAAFRREGELAARRVLDGDPPFDRDWAAWRPEGAWGVPRLPRGWDWAATP